MESLKVEEKIWNYQLKTRLVPRMYAEIDLKPFQLVYTCISNENFDTVE